MNPTPPAPSCTAKTPSAALALDGTDFDVLGGLALGGCAEWGYRRSFVREEETTVEPEPEVEGVAEVSARD